MRKDKKKNDRRQCSDSIQKLKGMLEQSVVLRHKETKNGPRG